MKLLEDGNRECEAVLDLQKEQRDVVKSAVNVCAAEIKCHMKKGSYQVCNDFLKKLGAFLHLILWASQLNNVTLLRWVREVDNHLEDNQTIYKVNQNNNLYDQPVK